MSEHIAQLKARFDSELLSATGDAEATALRDRWLGRKGGIVTAELKALGTLSPDERRSAGQELNHLKSHVEDSIDSLQQQMALRRETEQLARERIDISLPGRRQPAGHLHPITLLRQNIEDIFVSLWYTIEDGPEIATDFYNFDALTFPLSHPP